MRCPLHTHSRITISSSSSTSALTSLKRFAFRSSVASSSGARLDPFRLGLPFIGRPPSTCAWASPGSRIWISSSSSRSSADRFSPFLTSAGGGVSSFGLGARFGRGGSELGRISGAASVGWFGLQSVSEILVKDYRRSQEMRYSRKPVQTHSQVHNLFRIVNDHQHRSPRTV